MKLARPTVEQERWLVLAARYPALRAAAHPGKSGGWKTATRLGRYLGFLLALLAISLLGGALSQLPSPLLIGGVLLVIAAELLVARRRAFRSGVEEAVYVCGAVALVVQVLIWSTGNNAGAGIALIATAVLLVGWRLLNPLFTTLGMAGYSLGIAMFNENLFGGRLNTLPASLFCGVVAVVALVAGAREWQRPSHDSMLDGLVIVMPWLSYSWLMAYGWEGSTGLAWASLLLALVFVAMNLISGAQRRAHAPLLSALGSVACAVFSLYRLLHWPMHWRLIAAGTLLLAVAILLERRLRDRAAGITSSAIDHTDAVDLVQLAGAAHLSPAAGAAPEVYQGQGGGFGGGGASGRF